MSPRNKIVIGISIAVIVVILGTWYWQNALTKRVVSSVSENTILEQRLLGTAWVQLDENNNATAEEIDFLNTKGNDPGGTYYDYQEYLHQRPGESGYWEAGTSTITVIGNPSDLPPVNYIDVNIVGNILNVTDPLDGTRIKFKLIKN